MIGTTLGHYRLTHLLGEGGMGRVYAAEDLRLGRRVALKLLPDALEGVTGHVERFQREARLLAAVNHPNVITVHSVEEADGRAFITMELVEGETLLQRIRPGGLPLEEILAVAIPLADALAAAHANGIVHRDLKPANVMIGRDGRLKVVDFGIARPDRGVGGGNETAPLTGAGLVLGTPSYMAPEQLQGEPIDARADVFAFGVLVYELATGVRPFTGRSNADVVSAILRDPPPPLRRQRGDLPEPLQDILAACLQKDPGRRVDSAATVARALQALRTGQMAAVAPSRPDITALAVLPLQEIGGHADDLLADGITEALIADLARASGLKVISRSSVMRFRDSDEPPQQIASRLGVDALVMGSVRRSGNRIRISVELIEPASERVLWADRYDRELEDVLRLQDEMARAIADGVNANVGQRGGQAHAPATPRQVDPAVYLLDLKGRGQVETRTPASFRAALAHFHEALARDPSYGPSWIGLVRTRNLQVNYGLEAPDAVRAEMETALARAREFAADPAEVLAEHAQMLWQGEYDWVGADAQFCRALAIAPNNARVWYWRGIALGSGGHFDAAFECLDRAESLDPLSYFMRAARALLLYQANRLQEALAPAREVVELSPDHLSAYWILGMVHAALGNFDEAIAHAQYAASRMGRIGRAVAYLGLAYARSGRHDEAREVLRELEGDSGQYVPPSFGAIVLQGLGETEQALARLERALAERDSMLRDIRVDRAWDALRDEPRFVALQARMRFPGSDSEPTRVQTPA